METIEHFASTNYVSDWFGSFVTTFEAWFEVRDLVWMLGYLLDLLKKR